MGDGMWDRFKTKMTMLPQEVQSSFLKYAPTFFGGASGQEVAQAAALKSQNAPHYAQTMTEKAINKQTPVAAGPSGADKAAGFGLMMQGVEGMKDKPVAPMQLQAFTPKQYQGPAYQAQPSVSQQRFLELANKFMGRR